MLFQQRYGGVREICGQLSVSRTHRFGMATPVNDHDMAFAVVGAFERNCPQDSIGNMWLSAIEKERVIFCSSENCREQNQTFLSSTNRFHRALDQHRERAEHHHPGLAWPAASQPRSDVP